MTEAERARLKAELRRRKAQGKQADMSLRGRVKDNLLGVDDGVMSTGEKIGTWLNKAGEAMTFGLVGDEASAAVAAAIPGGMGYDERLAFERANEAQLERENPGAALGAEITGGVIGAMLPGGAIGTLGRGAGMGARIAASGAAGAGMGGLYGFMEGEGAEDRVAGLKSGAAFGAAAGAAAPVVGAAVRAGANKVMQRGPVRRALRSAESAADLRAASGRAYNALDETDPQVTPEAFSRLRGNISERLNREGATYLPGPMGKLQGNAKRILKTLDAMEEQLKKSSERGEAPQVRLKAIDDLRKEIGVMARETKDFRPTNNARLAGTAIDEIDQFVDGLRAEDMPVGDPDAMKSALKKARDLWRRSIKVQKVESAMDEAQNYLSGTESGLRNQVKSLLRRNKKEKLFTPKEEAALRRIIGNNMIARGLRILGDGLGRKMAAGGGFAMGGLEGAAVGAAAGEAASQIADSAAIRRATVARELIASGALENLPEAPGAVRMITERLVRRIGAVAPQ